MPRADDHTTLANAPAGVFTLPNIIGEEEITVMSVVTFANGSVLDHIAWAVPDTVAGCEQLATMLGVEPTVLETEPGQWYRSGSVTIGHGQALEILGPAPDYPHFHPLRALLSTLSEPRLLFWYVGTNDMDAFAAAAEAAGRPLAMADSVTSDDPSASTYRRAMIGQGFDPAVPSVIQWIRRRQGQHDTTGGACTIEVFDVFHPAAAALQSVFDGLGIAQRVQPGDQPGLRLTLGCPRGTVVLEGFGNPADRLPAG
jgi:hypothetical protein